MMRGIESNDGLKPYLNNPDKAMAGLARTIVTAAKAWREAYGDIPLPGQTVLQSKSEAEQAFYTIPEGTGIRFTHNIGGKSADQLETEAKGVGNVSGYASDMLHNPKFTTLEKVTPIELLKLRVQDLGLSGTPTTKQIFERIPQCRVGEMVLDLCPAEVDPHQRIADTDQPLNDWYYIVHEPISDRHGLPGVFSLGRDDSGLWLDDFWASPDLGWDPEAQFVVSLRKPESVKA